MRITIILTALSKRKPIKIQLFNYHCELQMMGDDVVARIVCNTTETGTMTRHCRNDRKGYWENSISWKYYRLHKASKKCQKIIK
jgi:hypothetical protein